jgi:hypothetical protein
MEHTTVTDLADEPVYENSGAGAPGALPGDSDIWVAQVTGTGTQELVWEARTGDWTLVVMNADGSRGITTEAAAGATAPALDWLVPTLLVIAAVGLVVSILLLVVALRASSTPTVAPTAPPPTAAG